MVVATMAAAVAASLPAPPTTSAPAAPQYEPIPASMSKVIDVEVEIPLSVVQMDGLVVTKITKHACEAGGSSGTSGAHGLLLGLDIYSVLEVSNCFPLVMSHGSSDEDKSSKSIARYQASMLRSLKEVQADDSVVGFYQATPLGVFLNQTLVEGQAVHQEKLRHGGVVVVYDLSSAARGNASFRAFRLTKPFLEAYKKSNFGTPSLIGHRLTFSSILEEVPLKIRTNPLLSTFLNTLTSAKEGGGAGDSAATLGPSFLPLELGTSGQLMTRNLESIIETVDAYRTEESNVNYVLRQIQREKARAESYVAKRKEENAARVAQGLAPLPEEDVTRLFKVPAEPSRLDWMLLLGQMEGYAKSLEGMAGSGLVRMYAARGPSLT